MSLTSPRSILRQTILLFNSLHNLSLMIFRHNWFLSLAFLIAVFSATVNSSLYMAIASSLLFLSCMATIICKLSNQDSGWQIQGGISNTIILVSLLLICLVIPQVETDMANFSNPTDNLETRLRQS